MNASCIKNAWTQSIRKALPLKLSKLGTCEWGPAEKT